MRSQRARREEIAKNAKNPNLQYVPQKTLNFQGPKAWKILKNYKNSCRRRSSKKDDPREAVFTDFNSIWEVPGNPKITGKQLKVKYKKEVEIRVLSPTGPQRAPDAN